MAQEHSATLGESPASPTLPPLTHRVQSAARGPRAALVVLTLLAVTLACVTFAAPVSNTGSDPRYSLLTAQAILQHGTIRLDAYRDAGLLPENDARVFLIGGHTYYYSALGTPILALPAVWVANRFGLDMADLAEDAQVQRVLASLLCALTLVLAYVAARCYVEPWPALVMTAVLVFGSTLTSANGSALWNFNATVVLILLCLLLLARYDTGNALTPHPWLLGTLLFAAYLCRPTTIIFVALVVLYVLARNRHIAGRVAAFFVIPLAILVFYSWDEFGLPLPPYYLPEQHGISSTIFLDTATYRGDEAPILLVLYGLLFSPSRGLFVYSPMLLVVLIAAPVALAQPPRRWITLLGLAWFAAHIVLLLRHNIWWGGHGYGPRISTDILPAFLLLASVGWAALCQRRQAALRSVTAAAFLSLGAVAVVGHTVVGLYNLHTLYWNGILMPPELSPPQVFEWRYPQFAANAQRNCARNAEFLDGLLRSRRVDLYPYTLGGDIDANDANDVRPVALDPYWHTRIVGDWLRLLPWNAAAGENAAPEFANATQLYLPFAANRARGTGPAMLSALFVGWSFPRGEVVVSLCERATVVLGPVHPDAARGEAQIMLEMTALTSQEVEVRVNDAVVGRVRLEANPDGAMATIRLPFDAALLSATKANRITLVLMRGPQAAFAEGVRLRSLMIDAADASPE